MAQAIEITWKPRVMDSDLQLIQRIASGDEAALRDFFARHASAMLAYAIRLVNDPTLAEEIVQESLVAVWKGAGNYRGMSKLLSWVLGIVYHKSMSALRERQDLPLEEDSLHMPEQSMPGSLAERSDRTRILVQALNELPPDQKSTLELVFFQRMSLDETAEVMKCSPGTIKSRLFTARNNLRKIFARHGYTLEDLL
jgi:RNA polymerase sigma-70 factor, ECF subfamily